MNALTEQEKIIRKSFNKLMKSHGYTVHSYWNCAKRFTNGYHLVMLRSWIEKSSEKVYFQIISGIAYDMFTFLYQDVLDIPIKKWIEFCCVSLHYIGSTNINNVNGTFPWELSINNLDESSQIILEVQANILNLLQDFDNITNINQYYNKILNVVSKDDAGINARTLIHYLILSLELNHEHHINHAKDLINQKLTSKVEDIDYLLSALQKIEIKYQGFVLN